jgi:hypothetical protein
MGSTASAGSPLASRFQAIQSRRRSQTG